MKVTTPDTTEDKRIGKDDDERLIWLVENRNRIQSLSLQIVGLQKQYRDILYEDGILRAVYGLTLGASFSLWRAVFITHKSQNWANNLDVGTEYIKKVIRANAILANDDFNMQDWAFGYYSGSTAYRIRDMCERHDEIKRAIDARGFGNYLDRSPPHLVESTGTWERHCGALEVAVSWLSDRLKAISPQSN